MLLITAATGAWAQGPWASGDCTVTLSNGTLTVSGNGAMADYEDINDRPWHNNTNDITSVVVESGVTTVGINAFYDFGNLTSVTLPEGLTAISPYAFQSCVKLTSVTIPSTVTSIDADAFMGCYAMTDVNLYADPDNLTWNEDTSPNPSCRRGIKWRASHAYQWNFLLASLINPPPTGGVRGGHKQA